jgi:formiminotetrahydrofolate cyclodeaminase
MLKRLQENLVMAFSSKNINSNTVKEEPLKAPLSSSSLNLTKEEVEVVLLTIKDTTFKGEHVEKVYNLVLKLQQYYISLNR